MQLRYGIATAAIATMLVAAGCGTPAQTPAPPASSTPATSPASSPQPETSCTADSASAWSSVPPNVAAQQIADILQVPVANVRAGAFGPAVCDQPVSSDAIGSGHAPVVSAKNIASLCAVIGVKNEADTKPGAHAKQVLLVCAKTPGA